MHRKGGLKKYPASKSKGVPDHLALRATCTFLGLRVCAETREEDTQNNSIITISVTNPDLKWSSLRWRGRQRRWLKCMFCGICFGMSIRR